MQSVKRDPWQYALAALATIAALCLRGLLHPLLGTQNPYHTVWLAMVFAAWYCGLGPSMVAICIAVFGTWYWFLPPVRSFTGKSPSEIFGVLGFLIFSGVIVALGESSRRVLDGSEQAEQELRKTRAELESRVAARTEELQQRVAEVAEKAAMLDLANDAIFVKTADSAISYWNQGAERLYGWTVKEALGRSPHELLHTEFPVPLHEIEERDRWEGYLRHTKRDGTQIEVASRWTTLRDDEGKPAGWLEINTDITSRKKAEDAARRLSGRLLTLQDDERRRIARELHDSLGQLLTALKMNLDQLPTADGNRGILISQCADLVAQCLTETRTLSQLLHPPLLDEAGIGSAVRGYVEGFGQRSGIKVDLDLLTEVGRLHKDVEIALFRAVQEGLTNAYRHSGTSEVSVSLGMNGNLACLEIKDTGRGMSEEQLNRLTNDDGAAGVGLAGMRERVRQLGGSLEIRSNSAGTKLRVTIPIFQRSPQSAHEDDAQPSVSIA
jgi:PAS domain S-box-containing protein